MNKIYCGIDPGIKGAICFLLTEKEIPLIFPMPIIGKRINKQAELDIPEIINLFKDWSSKYHLIVLIEEPIAFPGLNSASIGKTFEGFGVLKGIIQTLELKTILIKPRLWQKIMYEGEPKFKQSKGEKPKPGFRKKFNKETSARVAKRLWPACNFKRTSRCQKPDDGFTDASLISEYGRRLNL